MQSLKRISVYAFVLLLPILLHGHFQVVLPSTDIVEGSDSREIIVDLFFCHPFEGDLMNMTKPQGFGVCIQGGKKEDLLESLTEKKVNGLSRWQTIYQIKKPGDHVFYTEPKPYWESAEGKFIIHYTKVVVDAFGLELGWDVEVGMETEILPLTRPYGLYTGNLFRGVVLVHGKPAPFANIEVEYYNENREYQAPASSFITQVIKTDINGVFSYAMPFAGWWGFAALSESDEEIMNPDDGKYYPVELGALIWVRTANIK